MESGNGDHIELESTRWHGPVDSADEFMLSRCDGPSLDVGCGPGRLTAALATRKVIALGIDTSTIAVERAKQRGAAALKRDVFSPVPGEGRWRNVLLADGNIGIGGDPVILLRRVGQLLAPHGTVLVELAPHGTGLRRSVVRVRGRDVPGSWFPWAWLGSDAIAAVAGSAALSVTRVHSINQRWFAELTS